MSTNISSLVNPDIIKNLKSSNVPKSFGDQLKNNSGQVITAASNSELANLLKEKKTLIEEEIKLEIEYKGTSPTPYDLVSIENAIRTETIKSINLIKNNIPPAANNFVNVSELLNNYSTFLISKIQPTFNNAKSGKGGDKFAKEVFDKFTQLVSLTLNKISGVKKFFIKSALNKEIDKIMKINNIKNRDEALIFTIRTKWDFIKYIIDDIINYSYLLAVNGYDTKKLPKSDYNNIDKFGTDATKWSNENEKIVTTQITNVFKSFLNS